MGEVADRRALVRARLACACARAGRDGSSVTLVAVSKTHPAAAIRECYAAGQRDFGESYAQELAKKRAALADLEGIRWHFIGALQSNKARLVVPGAAMIHALDRASTAEAIAKRAQANGTTVDALVEVNVGGEASKAGLAPDGVESFVTRCESLAGLAVRGLMCLPPNADDAEQARPFFQRLRELRDALRIRHPTLELLSMGMTHDFEVAIEEGATHVRVGTAIFGEREYR